VVFRQNLEMHITSSVPVLDHVSDGRRQYMQARGLQACTRTDKRTALPETRGTCKHTCSPGLSRCEGTAPSAA
jgi:hypothetical protein